MSPSCRKILLRISSVTALLSQHLVKISSKLRALACSFLDLQFLPLKTNPPHLIFLWCKINVFLLSVFQGLTTESAAGLHLPCVACFSSLLYHTYSILTPDSFAKLPINLLNTLCSGSDSSTLCGSHCSLQGSIF